MSKYVAFVQPSFPFTGPKIYDIPYASGVLWAYALTVPTIKENYSLKKFVWKHQPVDELAESLADCAVVGFSTYVWNHNYNFNVAEKIKQLNPNVLIVFGGPDVAITDSQLFAKHPYVDIVVVQEGEVAFSEILLNLETKDFTHVPGILINDNGAVLSTDNPKRILDLSSVPSPYLIGLFDDLIAIPDSQWMFIIETTRGCPYQCTFCDWGSLTYSKVKQFPLEKVFGELEWAATNNINSVFFTDANFGIFPERDNKIADKIIQLQKSSDNLQHVVIQWAKNSNQAVIDIFKKLSDASGARSKLVASVQSLTPEVLTNIKRKNLAVNQLEELFTLCEENGLWVRTELILGLPGETLETWKENYYKLYRLGNHTGIIFYFTQLLENAELTLTQQQEFEMEYAEIHDMFGGPRYPEVAKMVIATKHMPREKMEEAVVFSWMQQTWHINHLSTFISRFLRKRYDIDYSTFYANLEEQLLLNKWFNKERQEIIRYYRNWITLGRTNHPKINDLYISGSNLANRTIFNLKNTKDFTEIQDVLFKTLTSFNISDKVVYDVLKLQIAITDKFYSLDDSIIEVDTNYNIWEYVTGSDVELIETPMKYCVVYPETVIAIQEDKTYIYVQSAMALGRRKR